MEVVTERCMQRLAHHPLLATPHQHGPRGPRDDPHVDDALQPHKPSQPCDLDSQNSHEDLHRAWVYGQLDRQTARCSSQPFSLGSSHFPSAC